MSAKTIQITLSGPWFNDPNDANRINKRFRVERIKNSTEFMPSSFLDEPAVRQLCMRHTYDVTLVPVPTR